MIIYKVTNLINGKIYVGQTANSLEKRWKDHCRTGYLLNKAIKKYGKENFTIEQIDMASSKEECDEKEKNYIKELKSHTLEHGYNLELGGNGPGKHSEVTLKKMSESQLGEKNHMFGKRFSNEFKLKHFSNRSGENSSCFGRKHTKESRQKMSAALKGRTAPNKGKKGKTLTREDRINKSLACGGRSFCVYKKDSNEFVGEWINQSECANDLNLYRKNIGTCLKGLTESYKGYVFQYKGALDVY